MSDVGKGAVIVFGAPVRRFPDYLITVAGAAAAAQHRNVRAPSDRRTHAAKPSAIMLLLLSVHSAAFLASARLAATTRLAMTALPATGPANRAAVGINMYLPEDEPHALLSRVQWVKTESGLSFKEIEAGSGAVPGPRETVTIAYKASFLSSGGYAEAGQTRLCWGAAEEAAPHGDASQMQKRRRPAGGGGGGKRGRW